MHKIHKQIVTDEAMRPIAVQIGYSDWMDIERALGMTEGAARETDLSSFSGVISLFEDPLAFQTRIRGEWR
jgi:hypothetical protein